MNKDLEKLKESLDWGKIPTHILLEEFRKRYLSSEIGIWTKKEGMMLVDEKDPNKGKVELTFN